MNDIKQVIVVRKDLKMRKGKMCAQVAHASMKFLLANDVSTRTGWLEVALSEEEIEWTREKFTKIVLGCASEEELRDLIMRAELKNVECHPIIDSGKTEFHGVPTLTCAAFGPARSSDVDVITGHLKPL